MKRTRSSSSSSSDANGIYPLMDENDDLISKLPDDILQMILSKLSTPEAARTSVLSNRWVGLWRRRPDLVLDMRSISIRTPNKRVKRISNSLAKSLTKVMKNHSGTLESCTIHHLSYQSNDGTLESWIQLATRVKNTKALTLETYFAPTRHLNGYGEIIMSPNTFSHQSLSSLSLRRFIIRSPQSFNGCSNLKTLKLVDIIIDVNDLSRVLAACSSLEVLLLQLVYLPSSSVLRVLRLENNNLKYLQMSTHSKLDLIEVRALRLEVIDIRYNCCEKDNFILVAPNLKFNRNYTVVGVSPHISCNISYLTQEKKSVWKELMLCGIEDIKRCGSLSVSIDITKPEEVAMFKEVLLMWVITEMDELEILFKNNLKEEGECSTTNRKAHRKLLEKSFPDADFRVHTVWMYNFSGSNKKEFELASQFVMQKTVIEKIMIETSSFPPLKKLMVEAKVDKLKTFAKGNEGLIIQCF